MSVKPSDGIGARLAKYRRLAGLSARELAERAGIGVSRGVIANIESGRKGDMTVDQLIAISAVLGIPPAALAIPIDEPFRVVRLSGQSVLDDERLATRAAQAVAWFNGWDRAPGLSDVSPSTVVAVQQLRLLEEYLKHFHDPNGVKPEELTDVFARMRDAGFDMTKYKVDE